MSATSPSYRDAIDALNSCQTNFANLEAIRKAGGSNYSNALEEMKEWMRRGGYEDAKVFDKLNVIHVTGTKGKGSTCAFVQSILTQYRRDDGPISKIGLYTSPHLKSVRERIQINGQPISEDKFTKYFFEVWDKLDETKSDESKYPDMNKGGRPSYFRFLTLLAFHVFVREKVDTAILEVGIGGEYDSTNIVVSPTATGVTSLGIDHVQVLGDTIEKIAWNKGGIFKPSAKALTVSQPESALQVLKERAAERHTQLEVVPVDAQVHATPLGLPAAFQEVNASLAVKLCQEHLKKVGIEVTSSSSGGGLPKEFITGLEKASWPGRCQTIVDSDGKTTWYLDGAHTKESIEVGTTWFGQLEQKKRQQGKPATAVLFFNQQTRNANALVGTLYETLASYGIRFDHVVFSNNVTWDSGSYSAELTSMNTSKEAVDGLVVQKELASAWSELDSSSERHVYGSIEAAQKFIHGLNGDVDVFVTGSLHLIGGLLAVMDGKPDN